ncbi:MAG TPA: hypothetical protein VK914_07730 [bacterium]|jgi:hypothetical protein|nr:hypothetical protein [bacterium]
MKKIHWLIFSLAFMLGLAVLAYTGTMDSSAGTVPARAPALVPAIHHKRHHMHHAILAEVAPAVPRGASRSASISTKSPWWKIWS